MGDGGYSGEYPTDPQTPAKPYGKILRINPTPTGTASYTVPADNPFVGQAGKEPLVWASGFRNPQYFSWRRGGDGTMYINDIGEAKIEEVDTGIAGGNYGWSVREGTYATWRDPTLGLGPSEEAYKLTGAPEPGLLFPVAQYDHSQGAAIGSGLIYQGKAIPALVGQYVVSDIVGGYLFVTNVDGRVSSDTPGTPATFSELGITYNGAPTTLLDILGAGRADARIGTDDNGELYVVTKFDGEIFRVTAVPAPGAFALLPAAALASLRRPRGRTKATTPAAGSDGASA